MVSNSIADYKFLKLKAIVGAGGNETVQLALMKKPSVSRSLLLLDNSIQVFPLRPDSRIRHHHHKAAFMDLRELHCNQEILYGV